jgi:hypothetical protein
MCIRDRRRYKMHKIRDPRDGRKRLTMINQCNLLGFDATAWKSKDGEISVYRSFDCPKNEEWIHGLNLNNYEAEMEYDRRF